MSGASVKLRVVHPLKLAPAAGQREIAAPDGSITLGRGLEAEWRVVDPDLSRCHARFFWQAGHFYVVDVGSRNGTLVAGQLAIAHQPVELTSSTRVQVGPLAVEVALAGGELSGTAYRPVETQGVAHAGELPVAVTGKPQKRFRPGTSVAHTDDKTAYYEGGPSLPRRLSEWTRCHKLVVAGFAGFALLMPGVLIAGDQRTKAQPRPRARASLAHGMPPPASAASAMSLPVPAQSKMLAAGPAICTLRDQPSALLRNAITAYADGNFAKAKELYECLAVKEPTDIVSREMLLRISEHPQEQP